MIKPTRAIAVAGIGLAMAVVQGAGLVNASATLTSHRQKITSAKYKFQFLLPATWIDPTITTSASLPELIEFEPASAAFQFSK